MTHISMLMRRQGDFGRRQNAVNMTAVIAALIAAAVATLGMQLPPRAKLLEDRRKRATPSRIALEESRKGAMP